MAVKIFYGVLISAVLGGLFFVVLKSERTVVIMDASRDKTEFLAGVSQSSMASNGPITDQKPLKETTFVTSTINTRNLAKKLQNPPKTIYAVYATSWSASSPNKIQYFINLAKETGVNAVVVDIKDYSGTISYRTNDQEISKYGAEERRIRDVDALVNQFHDNQIYVIGRITVFQDPILAVKRSDLAVQDSRTHKVWKDSKGLSWMDPSSKEVWDYDIAIAKNGLNHGFDEINFDYVRFPSDGSLHSMKFPNYDGIKSKSDVIKEFFKYTRESLQGEKISADLFGLSTVNYDDMGIGQIIENAYLYFDYVSPMVYPSHFASGFLGYKNPADHPYEVVSYSMNEAQKRLTVIKTGNSAIKSELRPWIQDFNLGAKYGVAQVADQVKAVSKTSANGWMVWSPTNIYTRKGLTVEKEALTQN